MAFLYHSSTFLNVNRLDDELHVECIIPSNDTEVAAWAKVVDKQ